MKLNNLQSATPAITPVRKYPIGTLGLPFQGKSSICSSTLYSPISLILIAFPNIAILAKYLKVLENQR